MAANQSDLLNKDGVEYPTHTTSHNQVVAAKVADPSGEVMDNYVQMKTERELSWDQVASSVSVQDPALAEYLRKNGPAAEKAQKDAAGEERKVLTELATNPLATKEEREARLAGRTTNPEPVVPATSPKGDGASAQTPDDKKK